MITDKDAHQDTSTSKVAEPKNVQDVIKLPIQEIKAPKEEICQKLSRVSIVDITEDTPVKNQVLIKEEIQAEEEKDISLPSSNIVLLKVIDYPKIDDTSTVNTTPTKSEVVTIDMLAGISTTKEQDPSTPTQ